MQTCPPKVSPSAHNKKVFILRHSMQRVLHEAINNDQKTCCGILTGNGNIVTKTQSVTSTLFTSPVHEQFTDQNSHLIGVYLATDKHGSINPVDLEFMHQIEQQQKQDLPFYYLILHMNHKGRIDAHMYSDLKFQHPITLLMREDI